MTELTPNATIYCPLFFFLSETYSILSRHPTLPLPSPLFVLLPRVHYASMLSRYLHFIVCPIRHRTPFQCRQNVLEIWRPKDLLCLPNQEKLLLSQGLPSNCQSNRLLTNRPSWKTVNLPLNGLQPPKIRPTNFMRTVTTTFILRPMSSICLSLIVASSSASSSNPLL